MNRNQILLIVIVAVLLAVIMMFMKIRRSVRRMLNSAEVRLVRELIHSAQNGELQQEEQPKSLGGMTSIYLPQIQRDFPEFNWEELRVKIEQSVRELLERKNVREAGVVRIHKSVISRYQKYSGTASIRCETAAEYWAEEAGNRHKKQTVCESELVYVYDSGLSGTAASVVCPNCGAPVEQLGVKKCRYCGSVLNISGYQTWKIQNVQERKDHNI